MSDLVERVALASLNADTSPDAPIAPFMLGAQNWARELKRTRAGIAAMREPTPEMIDAAFDGPAFTAAGRDEIADGWRAMIDALLKEAT